MTVRCAVFSKVGDRSGDCDFVIVPRVGDKVRLPWMTFVQTVVEVLHTGSTDAERPAMVAIFVEGVPDSVMREVGNPR